MLIVRQKNKKQKRGSKIPLCHVSKFLPKYITERKDQVDNTDERFKDINTDLQTGGIKRQY